MANKFTDRIKNLSFTNPFKRFQFASQMEGKTKPLPMRDLSRPIGRSGTNILDGYISDDYNTLLDGLNGYSTYKKMWYGDAQVAATLSLCINPIIGTDWYIEPATDENGEVTPEYELQAKSVEKALFDDMEITFEQVLFEVLTSLVYGVSVFEKVYTYGDDGMITIKKIASRKQNTIDRWETETKEAGITQVLPNTNIAGDYTVSIPAEKLLIFTHQRQGENYEGVSVLRSAYKHWDIKNQLYKFDTVKQEKTSMPTLIGIVPTSATQESRDELLDQITRARVNENGGIVISEGFRIEAIDYKSNNSTDLFKSINHHNTEIPKCIIANFIDLGNTESGSRALDESKTEMFLQALENYAKHIASVFNRYLIQELVSMNFETDRYPKLRFKSLMKNDNKTLSEVLSALTNAGLITNDIETEQHIRKTVDLPPKSQEAIEEAMQKVEDMRNNMEKGSSKKEISKEDQEDMKDEEFGEGMIEYLKFSERMNNDAIIKLQNECRSPEEFAELKKKGFKTNEYESQSPRTMTFAERKVNFKSLKRAMDSFDTVLKQDIKKITSKQKEDLIKQVRTAVEKNDIAKLGEIRARHTGELSQAITDVQKEMFEIGKKSASSEMNVKVPPTKAEVRGAMRVQNDGIVNKMATDAEQAAKLSTTELINKKGGSIAAVTVAEATAAATAAIDKVLKQAEAQLNTFGITGAVNMGRASIFERYPEKIYAVQYSAILDSKTTLTCASLDGRVVRMGSQDYYDYSPPRHYNCRSVWVEILNEEEFKPPIQESIPKSIPKNATIDTHKEMKRPVILKNSPSRKIIENELKQMEAKLDKYKQSNNYQKRQESLEKKISGYKRSLGVK